MVDRDAALQMVAALLGWDQEEADRFLVVNKAGLVEFTKAGMVQLVTTQADAVRAMGDRAAQAEASLQRLDMIEGRRRA